MRVLWARMTPDAVHARSGAAVESRTAERRGTDKLCETVTILDRSKTIPGRDPRG